MCSGGGTGGHIFPAVAVAQELKNRFPDSQILFIGAKGKMEMTKVPKAGFPIKGLWISGLQRSLTIKNVLFPLKLGTSLIDAYFILKKFRPDVVVGFGGYASGAALWVASKMRIPTVIMEQNSLPGLTNKLLNGKADIVCIAYEEARRYFDKSETILTGNPIRKGLLKRSDRIACRKELGLDPDRQTVLIIGGSLGAASINKTIAGAFDLLAANPMVQWIWQCGSGYMDQYRDHKTAALPNVHLKAFIDDMNIAYGASDLVISRAGALTIAELMHMGKPAILVPSPNVAEDHQTVNAKAIHEKQAAVLLPDEQLDQLVSTVLALLAQPDKLKSLAERIHRLAKPQAVAQITDQVIKMANKRVQ